MDYTSRLLLQKPDPDPVTGDFVDVSVLNQNADAIDSTISFTVCTSTARPPVPFQGQAILETDTGKTYLWGGSGWLPFLFGNSIQIVTNLGIGTAPDATAARRLKTFWAGTMGGTSQVLLEQSGAATGSRALGIKAGGEANERYMVDFDGKMQWGPGIAGGDTTLYRSAADTLKTDDNFEVGGALTVTDQSRISGARIGTNIRTSDSGTFTTTETLIDSVTVPLVSGRTYLIRWTVAWGSSVAADTVFGRIRADSVAGTQLQILRVNIPATGGAGTRWNGTIEAEYTATATGNKTFVGTGVRATGTGNINAKGDATFPIYLYVNYIRG